jgi:hypothetical protein
MIGPLCAPEACLKGIAAIAFGVRDRELALGRMALDLTGQTTSTKTANQGQIGKRLEIVLG